MNNNNHTPGPWEVGYTDRNGQSVVKAEHIEIATCWHHCVASIEKEMHANARLIAAAPDLLASLELVMSWIDNWSPNFTEDPEWGDDEETIRAAIAKAK